MRAIPLLPLAFTLLFCAAAAWLRWPLWESAFRSDFSPVSWLSACLLFGGSMVSLTLARSRALRPGFALLMAAGLALLSMDEQFQLHEQWKYGCEEWLSACAHSTVRELPMLLVPAGGLLSGLYLHRSAQAGGARALLWSAVAVGAFAIGVDQLPMPAAIAGLEEFFEVVSESLFLGFLLSAAK